MSTAKTIFSGIQPTGNLHFGRYFGAVQNWVKLQQEYDCLYCVVNYHAMTMPFDPRKLAEDSWNLVINLLAMGVRPENLFLQSLVPEHTELGWILSCYTSSGQLSRMTQFKDKSQQSLETGEDNFISAGLLTYPVLQAADILLYQAELVPVGRDQEQHLELTRNIVQRFNHLVGREVFQLPEPLFTETPKIMSTADPLRKMSASLGDKHNIDVFADPKRIRKQIRSAVTDTGTETDGEMSAGVANLFMLLSAAGQSEIHQQLMQDYEAGQLRYVDLKDAVANALIDISEPWRQRRQELLADRKQVKDTIKTSALAIRQRAQATLKMVKEVTGLADVKY